MAAARLASAPDWQAFASEQDEYGNERAASARLGSQDLEWTSVQASHRRTRGLASRDSNRTRSPGTARSHRGGTVGESATNRTQKIPNLTERYGDWVGGLVIGYLTNAALPPSHETNLIDVYTKYIQRKWERRRRRAWWVVTAPIEPLEATTKDLRVLAVQQAVSAGQLLSMEDISYLWKTAQTKSRGLPVSALLELIRADLKTRQTATGIDPTRELLRIDQELRAYAPKANRGVEHEPTGAQKRVLAATRTAFVAEYDRYLSTASARFLKGEVSYRQYTEELRSASAAAQGNWPR
jgi:hypothetical protein